MQPGNFYKEDELSFSIGAPSGLSKGSLRASKNVELTEFVCSGGPIASSSPPASLQKSYPGTVFYPRRTESSEVGQGIQRDTSAVQLELAKDRIFNATLLSDTESKLRTVPDNKSVQPSSDLSHGRMAGPYGYSDGSAKLASSKHGVISESSLARDPLHVDTDLCLSLVHETRPSYDIKTSGKAPLSPGHLLSLVNGNTSDSNPPSKLSYQTNDPSPRGKTGHSSSYHQYSSISPEGRSSSYYAASSTMQESRRTITTKTGGHYIGGASSADRPSAIDVGGSHYPAAHSQAPAGDRYRHGTPVRLPSAESHSPSHYGTGFDTARSGAPEKISLFEKQIRFDTEALFREFEQDLIRKRSASPRSSSALGSRPPSISPGQSKLSPSSPSGRPLFINRPPTPTLIEAVQEDSHVRSTSYVSPRARGMAPAPSDQPIRSPKQTGVEGQVDHLTLEMYHNMMTGYGAAGDNNCAKCGQGVGGGRPGCTALNQTYHLECFTCCQCNGKLAGGSFYSVDGKPFCERDYMETLDKCTICLKPIVDRILRASGKPYHPGCFTCTACMKCLDGVPFTVDSNNEIHCVDCFHEKYAPRCARCSKPIVPEVGKEESLRVVAMDKSFHVDCYACQDCGLPLNSKIEGRGCYPLDNQLFCKECNMKRIQQQT